jgi:hypothetical protein
VLEATVTLAAGKSYSVAAHLTESGSPAVRLFTDNLTEVPAGKARFVVRNLASAPKLDVALNGKVMFSGLTDPDEEQSTVPAARYSVEARESSSDRVLIGKTDVNVKAGSAGFLYVIGSDEDNTLDFMYQDTLQLGAAPTDVLAGDGGLAATPGIPAWIQLVMATAGLGAVISALRVATHRSRRRAGFLGESATASE